MGLNYQAPLFLLLAGSIAVPPLHAASAPVAEASTAPCAMAAALQSLASPAFGTLDTNADYYIFIYSASWCAPCRALMKELVESIGPEIRKERSCRIEIVFMGLESAESLAAYRKEAGIDFWELLISG